MLHVFFFKMFILFLFRFFFIKPAYQWTMAGVPVVASVPQSEKPWCSFTAVFRVLNQKSQQGLRERERAATLRCMCIAYIVYTNHKQVLPK
jgi:hypothetical protein